MKRSDELAIAIAPLAAIVPAGLFAGKAALYVMLFGSLVSYLTAIAIGWPLLVFLRRRGLARSWILSLVGLALAVPFAALGLVFGWMVVVGTLLSGLTGGWFVWFLAVGPNSSFKPKPLRGSA